MGILRNDRGLGFSRREAPLFKAKVGAVQVVGAEFKSDPSPPELLGGFACCATANKRVQDHVTFVGEELDEKLRELNGESGRVRLDLFLGATLQVVPVRVVVSQREQIRR